MITTPAADLAAEIRRPRYLLLTLLGTVLFLSLAWIEQSPWGHVVATAGSTLVTLGLTLPIAVFAQGRANQEDFALLKNCHEGGVRAVFESRQRDWESLQKALDGEARLSEPEIWIMGIAFKDLFDPDSPHVEGLYRRVNSTSTTLRVLLLDPNCGPADRREQIELGVKTRRDIQDTLDTGLVSTAVERLRELRRLHASSTQSGVQSTAEELDAIVPRLNLGVRLYSAFDPMIWMVGFSSSVFVEQYHFGRPDDLPVGRCIGGLVPVTQYDRHSRGYECYRQHFVYIWNSSKDVSRTVIESAIKKLRDADQRTTSGVQQQ